MTCKSYVILYKGLVDLWILVSAGVLDPVPHGYQGMAVLPLEDLERLSP
jgi:hypothetical protein